MTLLNKLENSSMKNLHVDCLDQLILVVHLPDVSVTNTNDCHYLLYCILAHCKYIFTLVITKV